MRLLLDTHALLWWFTDDERLSARIRALIADEKHEIFVSAASAWEIATKQRIGKLDEVPEAASRFTELVAADGFIHLPITHLHSLRAGGYEVAHRDPLDRMLAAQSELESLALVTRDSAFEAFGNETIWQAVAANLVGNGRSDSAGFLALVTRDSAFEAFGNETIWQAVAANLVGNGRSDPAGFQVYSLC